MTSRVLRGVVEAWAPEVRSSASIIGVTGFLMATSKTMNSGRVDNDASLHVHARMGMQQVANFDFNGSQYAVLFYVG